MKTKVNAEFDSVENAELAVHAVRDGVSGLSDIRIFARKPAEKENKMYLCAMRSENNTTPYFIPAIPEGRGEFSLSGDFSEEEKLRPAVLEIICDSEVEHEVHSIILNRGGLKINKASI